jgi:hypothetical protein
MMSEDWADPRTWDVEAPRETVIYLSDMDASIVALLDEVDWEWARQWKWSFVTSKKRKNGTEKYYASRTQRSSNGADHVYLHKEIVRRAHGERRQ